ncbi:hypothetical protein LINPERHAP1_LOCUS13230 [Linum perenne]
MCCINESKISLAVGYPHDCLGSNILIPYSQELVC